MPNEKDAYPSTNGQKDVNSSPFRRESEHNDDAHINLNNSQESAYARLSPLRRVIRSFLLPLIMQESHIIARIQHRFRSPFLDAYFVYTSSLGTHTFFMILLPAMFFFGFRQVGMGLVLVMGLGVYGSSWMKDFVCSPRPLAPPVMRLTLGNHHLEYGFPSTHSTNSVSIALFFWGYLHASSLSPFSSFASDANSFGISPTITYIFFCFLLLLYTISIVFGRIYTAMHSFTDCFVGVVLGAIIWIGVTDAENGGGLGLAWGRRLEEWATGAHTVTHVPSLTPPLVLTTVFLTLVNQHPQPVDDCPCFEDALAMGAVVYGALLGRWACVYFGMDGLVERVGGPRPMIGSGWVLSKEELYVNATSAFRTMSSVNATEVSSHTTAWIASLSASPLWETLLFTLTALAKLVLGISMIFVWRLFAKSVLGLVLPSVFRAVARIVAGIRSRLGPGYEWLSMPNRRFYLPATEYQGGVPNELVLGGGSGTRSRPGQDSNDNDGRRAGNGGYEFDLDFARDDEEENDYEVDEYVGSGSGANTNGNGDMLGIPRQRGRAKERRGRIMRPIPSVIDLPASLKVGVEDQGGIGSDSGGTNGRDMKFHSSVGGEKIGSADEAIGARKSKHMKHYDADVLTKVIVYAGIAILSIEITPLVFELLGWGVYVWPPEGVWVIYK